MKKEREEFLIGEIKKDWRYLGEISKEEQTDTVINEAIDINICAFELIKDDSKKTDKMCLMVADSCYLWLLRHVPVNMKTDELIDALIDNKPVTFWRIKEESEETYEKYLNAISFVHSSLQHIPEKFKDKIKNELKYKRVKK